MRTRKSVGISRFITINEPLLPLLPPVMIIHVIHLGLDSYLLPLFCTDRHFLAFQARKVSILFKFHPRTMQRA